MLAGAALCALAAVLPRPARTPVRLRGIWVLVAFAPLAAFTALSITWSLMPRRLVDRGQPDAGLRWRSLAGGWRARPARARGAGARCSAASRSRSVVLCAWALLTKVFPAWLAADAEFARLRPPFEYWNSVGLAAALGLPPLLWLAARRSGHRGGQRGRLAGARVLVICLLFSYSRGALLAAAIGVVLWLARRAAAPARVIALAA